MAVDMECAVRSQPGFLASGNGLSQSITFLPEDRICRHVDFLPRFQAFTAVIAISFPEHARSQVMVLHLTIIFLELRNIVK